MQLSRKTTVHIQLKNLQKLLMDRLIIGQLQQIQSVMKQRENVVS